MCEWVCVFCINLKVCIKICSFLSIEIEMKWNKTEYEIHIEKNNIFLNASSSHGILFYFCHNRIHNELHSMHLRVRKISFVGQWTGGQKDFQ